MTQETLHGNNLCCFPISFLPEKKKQTIFSPEVCKNLESAEGGKAIKGRIVSRSRVAC